MATTATTPTGVCDTILELVGDRAEAIVSTTSGSSALTRFANSSIHQNVAEDALSVFVKLIVDGRAASASTTQTDGAALRTVVDRVLDAARLRPPDPDWPGLAPPAPILNTVEHWDDATASADPTTRAEVVRAFVDAGSDLEAAGYCSTSGLHYALANSAGLRLSGRHSAATINGIHRTASSDASATQTSTKVAELDGAAAGTEAADVARASRDAIEVEPGNYEVVLSQPCLANMLQFLAYAGFNAKAHADGTSFVHLGEQQFDTAVSIWDDATDPRTLGLPFDNEGTPKARVDLVRDGVTTSLVHDRRTARKAGAVSTGHSVGQEAAGAYPANLFFGAGVGSRADLIANVGRGLLVCDFWYTRILDPRTQVVTGLTRNGVFLIEDGKVGAAVKNMRFTQSFVAALGPGKVRGIAGDAKLVNGMHIPSVHLAGWNFTGGAKG
jgi:predicted Zn-dependent protease